MECLTTKNNISTTMQLGYQLSPTVLTSDQTNLSIELGSGPNQLAQARGRTERRSVAELPPYCMNAASLHQTVCHSQLPVVVCRDKTSGVDVTSPTHCPRLLAGQCYTYIIAHHPHTPGCADPIDRSLTTLPTRTIALLPLQCHYVYTYVRR